MSERRAFEGQSLVVVAFTLAAVLASCAPGGEPGPGSVVLITLDTTNPEALDHARHRLTTLGVDRKLARAGARTGETVRIGAFEFEYERDDELVLDPDDERPIPNNARYVEGVGYVVPGPPPRQ